MDSYPGCGNLRDLGHPMLRLPPGDDFFRRRLRGGEYFEIDHLRAAFPFVRQFGLAVDGGAHVGSWTRELCRRFEVVHAFEPEPQNFDCLVANTEGKAILHREALGAGPAEAGLAPGGNSGCWHLTRGLGVRVIALDSLELAECDLLKLDLEGAELYALQGAEVTLREHRPVVILERNGLALKHYGLAEGAVGGFLTDLGASLRARVGKDEVWSW